VFTTADAGDSAIEADSQGTPSHRSGGAWLAVAALAAVCIAALASTDRSSAGEPAPQVFRSDGYGLAIRLSGRSMEVFQRTRDSCRKVAVAQRRGDARRESLYLIDRSRSLPVLDVDSGRMFLRRANGTRRIGLTVEGAVSEIRFRRSAGLPAACRPRPSRSFRSVLDVFTQTFREHYPFFDLHNVDWTEATRRARSRVTRATTQRQLFTILRRLMAPLDDAHTWLESERGHLYFEGKRPDPQPLDGRDFRRVRRIVASYLVSQPRRFANRQISFAMLPGELGYLRVSSFSGYAAGPRLADELAEIDRALDYSLERPLAGLVIDVRVNDGGSDVLANRIVSRLTDRPYVAYSKRARDPNRARGFTPKQRVPIKPRPGARYTGPVAVLTSRYSVSAAETFTQALIGRRPPVQRIGEPTQGVFSDVLIRVLPNGWLFGVPNEVYLTDGRNYDVTGVPPTIHTGLVFKRSHLRAGRDPEIERAMEELRR
jgi:Peptidase family S41/Tricorn protease C1 domain